MSDILGLPQRFRKHWRLWSAITLAVLVVGGAVFWAVAWWSTWNRLQQLAPSGGLYFLRRVELAVPSFRQNDPLWGDDQLAWSENNTIGSHGCALSSAAMIFKFYGIDTNPQQLNWYLQAADGYTPEGWIYWDRAAYWAPDRVRHVYEDLPSYRLIDSNLARGNPVIVRLQLPKNKHFVVIAGKNGFDYLTQDPGRGASRGLYPLREIGSKIEALRFYEKLP